MKIGDYINVEDWNSISTGERRKFIAYLRFMYPEILIWFHLNECRDIEDGDIINLSTTSLGFYSNNFKDYCSVRRSIEDIRKMIELSPI